MDKSIIKRLFVIHFIGFLTSLICYSLYYFLENYLVKVRIGAHSSIIFLYTLESLFVSSVVIGGYLSDKVWGIKRSLLWSGLLTFISLLSLAYGGQQLFFFAAATGIAGMGFALTASYVLLFRCCPTHRLRYRLIYFTVLASVIELGCLFSYVIIALYLDHHLNEHMMLFIFLIMVLTLIATIFYAWPQLKSLESLPTSQQRLTLAMLAKIVLATVAIVIGCIIALKNDACTTVFLSLMGLFSVVVIARHYKDASKQVIHKLLAAVIILAILFISKTLFLSYHDLVVGQGKNILSIHLASLHVYVPEFGLLYRLLLILMTLPIIFFYYITPKWRANKKEPVVLFVAYALFGLSLLLIGSHIVDHNPHLPILSQSAAFQFNFFMTGVSYFIILSVSIILLLALVPQKLQGFFVGLFYLIITLSYRLSDTLSSILLKNNIDLTQMSFTRMGILILMTIAIFIALFYYLTSNIGKLEKYRSTISFRHVLKKNLSDKINQYLFLLFSIISIITLVMLCLLSRYHYHTMLQSNIAYFKQQITVLLQEDKIGEINYILQKGNLKHLMSQLIVFDKNKTEIARMLNKGESENTLLESNPRFHLPFLDDEDRVFFVLNPLRDEQCNIVGYYAYHDDFFNFVLPYCYLWLILSLFFVFFYCILTRLFNQMLIKALGDGSEKFNQFLMALEKLAKKISTLEMIPTTQSMYVPTYNEEQSKINAIVTKLITEINQAKQEVRKVTEEAEKAKFKTALAKVVSQVSHDVRSPLSALEVILHESTGIPEKTRTHLRTITLRIKDILGDLLQKNKPPVTQSEAGAAIHRYFTPLILDTLSMEKKAEYKQFQIDWHEDITIPLNQCFIQVNLAEFKRTLSNLVNNAIEASVPTSCIKLEFGIEDKYALIRITDVGKGIPSNVIDKLFHLGQSYDKPNGSGMGLYYAKQSIEKFHGTITLQSKENVGSTVTIRLPCAQPPSWFVPAIYFAPQTVVVVIDDDPSIHQVWQQKLSNLTSITLIHYYHPDELILYLQRHTHQADSFYLCDYEFTGYKQTGLTLIKTLNIAHQSILVTSHFDEIQVIRQCKKLGLCLIPKPMVWRIPVHLRHDFTTLKQAILIDDDPLVHNAWQLSARRHHIALSTFTGFKHHQCAITAFPKETVIFIDFHLSDGEKGSSVAKKLYDLGFTALYWTTGEAPSNLPKDVHIIAALDKRPPWVKR